MDTRNLSTHTQTYVKHPRLGGKDLLGLVGDHLEVVDHLLLRLEEPVLDDTVQRRTALRQALGVEHKRAKVFDSIDEIVGEYVNVGLVNVVAKH